MSLCLFEITVARVMEFLNVISRRKKFDKSSYVSIHLLLCEFWDFATKKVEWKFQNQYKMCIKSVCAQLRWIIFLSSKKTETTMEIHFPYKSLHQQNTQMTLPEDVIG